MKSVILLSVLLLSCIHGGRQGGSAKTDSTMGQEIKSTETLVGNTAKQVCQNLSSKSVRFRQNFLNKQFRLRVTKTDCTGSSSANDFIAVLENESLNAPLNYAPASAVSFYQFEDTHNFGAVSGLCPKILNGESVSNTIISGNTKTVFTFSSNKIVIEYATKNVITQKYLKDRTIDMQVSADGVVGPRSETILCNDGRSLVMTQSILSLP